MLKRHKIERPQGITRATHALDHMWLHAAGEDWQNKIDIENCSA